MSYRTTRAFEGKEPSYNPDKIYLTPEQTQEFARVMLTAFPSDVAEYKDHCPHCLRGPITLARMGHALTCANREIGT
jgi:hypothetical protein